MDVIHLNNTIYLNEPLVLTIGQFDGIHKAHQELIKKTVLAAKKQNAKSAVITFLPHIDSVIKGTNPNDYIIDMPSKIEILNNLNVDYLFIIDFNKEISSKPHQVFFQEYLNLSFLLKPH